MLFKELFFFFFSCNFFVFCLKRNKTVRVWNGLTIWLHSLHALCFPVLCFQALWNYGKFADAGDFAEDVDIGQCFFFSSRALGYKHSWKVKDRRRKKQIGIFQYLSWVSILRGTQLTWVSQWWRVINKCIELIINDSLNEDRYDLKTCWFEESRLNSDVVSLPHWWSRETQTINLHTCFCPDRQGLFFFTTLLLF